VAAGEALLLAPATTQEAVVPVALRLEIPVLGMVERSLLTVVVAAAVHKLLED
jgi:hypothetical protein